MKNIFILLVTFICFNSVAATNVDVLSADIGVADDTDRKTLCVTIVRNPRTTQLIGIVESIEDCFYARLAKKSTSHQLEVNLKDLKNVDHAPLADYLQSRDTQVKFYFSNGE